MGDKKISWLQISDLHNSKSSASTAWHESLKNNFDGKIDFLVITGDLHQYESGDIRGIGNYKDTIEEIEKIMFDVGLDSKKNVFMVPGNHDAGDFEGKKKTVLDIDENIDKNYDYYLNYVDELSKSFKKYQQFIKQFYGEDYFYDGQEIHNHLQIWNNKLAILHLNTALTCNGDNKRRLALDLFELSQLAEKPIKIPTIAIAHHDFFRLSINQQPLVRRYLHMLGVRTYLCGDTHRISLDFLRLGNRRIPMIVCGKSRMASSDLWSHVSVIQYRWDYNSVEQSVEVIPFIWDNRNPHLEKSTIFVDPNVVAKCSKENELVPNFAFRMKEVAEGKEKKQPKENLQRIRKKMKEQVRDSLLFPWMRVESPSFSLVEERLFIQPIVKYLNNGVKLSFSQFLNLYEQSKGHKRLWVLGDAGSGKTSILKYSFLKKIGKGQNVLYISAVELIQRTLSEQASYINKIINKEKKYTTSLIIMIDGIDEAFTDGKNQFDVFYKKVDELSCEIWFGCRTQFFEKHIETLAAHRIEIQPWAHEQSQQYVQTYFGQKHTPQLEERYLRLCSSNDCIHSFSTNPFRLSILIYLLENTEDFSNQITNIYSLYQEFFDIWIKKETQRRPSRRRKIDYYTQFSKIARKLYENEESFLATDNPVVLSLLNTELEGGKRRRVLSFYHRSFMEFILAREAIEAMKKGPQAIADKLTHNNRSDIDAFIKAGFSIASYSEKNKMVENMIQAYRASLNSSLPEEKSFYVQNQIIYYITRMKGMNLDPVKNFINQIYSDEQRTIVRQGIAYGAANLGIFDIALDFAKKMSPGSDEDRTNRSWTLVFYGDMPREDPIHYVDDGRAPWKRSRAARIRRLSGKRSKDQAFRMFDLCIMRGFFVSRNWEGLSEEELDVIKKCETDIPGYSQEVKDFLKETKEILVKEYEEHLKKGGL